MLLAGWRPAVAAGPTDTAAGTGSQPPQPDLSSLPANRWVLLDEAKGRGKEFAKLIWADATERGYLWGFGGKMLGRAIYERYELESYSPQEGRWVDALPQSRRDAWAGGRWPPFRLHGYEGTDGPRIRSVGSMSCNVVTFCDTDGIRRPSPVAIFNQACYDSKRGRVLFYAGGRMLALDVRTNQWADLAPARGPTACEPLAWASLCYDARRDRALLFGGGLALNTAGGAATWIYDCAANAWRRPALAVEPPPRCNAPIVYDAKADRMVLFGGYDQTAALNDTWVLDCAADRWELRHPSPSPPPMFCPAAAAVPGGGHILVVGPDARIADRGSGRFAAAKQAWAYDIDANTWRPAGEPLGLGGYDWLTADASAKLGSVFLVACRRGYSGDDIRRTYAIRLAPAALVAPPKGAGAPPGTAAWKFPEQRESLAAARPRPPEEADRFFRDLPANHVIDAAPPGLLISKTWSSATIDTDRGEVIYAGGGHSGYSGNDIAHYSLAENRWTLSWPPRFPPFLESTNASVYGWSYGRLPWSQHTYRWYAYDPLSRRVIYCARPAGPWDGQEVQLGEDPNSAFAYDRKKHGHLCWVYDPTRRRLAPPSLGRPFEQSWCLALVSTPRGVFARPGDGDGRLYQTAVRDDQVSWKVVDESCPRAGQGYHYEWQPLVYDGRRQRLLLLMGKGDQVELHARELGRPPWQRLETRGRVELSREVVYAAKADALVLLAEQAIYTLDLTDLRWRQLDVEMPEGQYRTECAMVYDPARDVCVMLIPSRFSGPLRTLLLRFDPKTAKYRQ